MTVPRPPIVSRAEWGARPPRGPYTPGRLQGWSYHHWASPGRFRAFDGDCEAIRSRQRQHMDTNGWNDIAGNFYVTRSGRIFEARPLDVAAGITGGYPLVGGVEHEGYFHPPYDEDPAAFLDQWEASVWLDAWVCDQYGWDPNEDLDDHQGWAGDTACAGDRWRARKAQYRGAVALLLSSPAPQPPDEEEDVAVFQQSTEVTKERPLPITEFGGDGEFSGLYLNLYNPSAGGEAPFQINVKRRGGGETVPPIKGAVPKLDRNTVELHVQAKGAAAIEVRATDATKPLWVSLRGVK